VLSHFCVELSVFILLSNQGNTHTLNMLPFLVILLLGVSQQCLGCASILQRVGLLNNFATRLGKAAQDDSLPEIPMINVPGQRFTATHGIRAKKGEAKLFLFTVEEYPSANYAAISANVAVAGVNGGQEKYSMYLKYGAAPTPTKFDYRSVVTASDSYVGDKLYSHDIRVERPTPGQYYLLIQAREDFHELLVTAIVDTPPQQEEQSVARGPGFTIQRMGRPQN